MATRLIQVIAFANVAPAATVNLPHSININDVAKKPDFVAADASGFSITVTATQVSVTNNNAAPTSVNVWLELKHSIPRELGALPNLTPQPFVASPGGASSSSGGGAVGWYGTGDLGDVVIAADTTYSQQTIDTVIPGNPCPAGSQPYANFNNLTIQAGATLALGTLTDIGDGPPLIIVRDTLTIAAGAKITVRGQDGVAGGLGRAGVFNSPGGANGGIAFGGPTAGTNGSASNQVPAYDVRNGGDGGGAGAFVGGLGGIPDPANVVFAYDLPNAAWGEDPFVGGAAGGGSGGGSGAAQGAGDTGGNGGGGGGAAVIRARRIVFTDPGSIDGRGGDGAPGVSGGGQAGGGGGGQGATIFLITDEINLTGLITVAGGAPGAGAAGGQPGIVGGAGRVIALNPVTGVIPT